MAKTDSPILDNLQRKLHKFEIGTFRFRMTAEEEYANFPDLSIYEITHEVVTFPFLLPLLICLYMVHPNPA